MPAGSGVASSPRSVVAGLSTSAQPWRATSTSTPLNLVASDVDDVETAIRPPSRSTRPASSRSAGTRSPSSSRSASSTHSARSGRPRLSRTSSAVSLGPSTTALGGHGIRLVAVSELMTTTNLPWAQRDSASTRSALVRPERGGPATRSRRPSVSGDQSTRCTGRRRPPAARRLPDARPPHPGSCGISVRRTSVGKATHRHGPPSARRSVCRARHGRGVVGAGVGELHLTRVVHPHRPPGWRVAGYVCGAQTGERRVERVDAAQQEGAPGDLAPARVQQSAPTRHHAHHTDRPAVAQDPQDGVGQQVGAVRRLGLEELVPAVDQQDDRRRRGLRGGRRSVPGGTKAPVDLVPQVSDQGDAGPVVVAAGARAQVGERAEVAQRPVGVDDLQVERLWTGGSGRREGDRPYGRGAPAARPADEQPGPVSGVPGEGCHALQVGLVDQTHNAVESARRRPAPTADVHHGRQGRQPRSPGRATADEAMCLQNRLDHPTGRHQRCLLDRWWQLGGGAVGGAGTHRQAASSHRRRLEGRGLEGRQGSVRTPSHGAPGCAGGDGGGRRVVEDVDRVGPVAHPEGDPQRDIRPDLRVHRPGRALRRQDQVHPE